MKLKRVIAGITALTVLGSVSCLPVFAESGSVYTETAAFDNASAVDNEETAVSDDVPADSEELPAAVIVSDEAEGIPVDENTFPDEVFREYVLKNIDDGDGVLSEDEIAAVTSIFVAGTNENKGSISSLKGVEYFVNLKSLNCFNNQITSLDVSKNTALTELTFDANQITSIDLSNNTALTSLRCASNQLTSLDVSENTALTELSCQYNQLTSLNVSRNTYLTHLYCQYNQLTSLDVTKNTNLTEINCQGNLLTSLDVSKNNVLYWLSCSDNRIVSFDFSQNADLKYLFSGNNMLTSLDVTNNTNLIWLTCSNNRLTSLDVSKNTALENLYCGGNQLTSLDLSKNTALTEFSCDNNTFGIGTVEGSYSLSELPDGFDPEKTSDWEGAELSEDKKSLVSFTSNTVTYNYDCGNDHTVKFTLIAESFVSDTDIKIDENNFPDKTFREYVLKNFDNGDGVLSEEEIAAVTSIFVAETNENSGSISSLKGIEYFVNLKSLNCFNNQITSLDVSKNTALTELTFDGNQITSIDLSNNTALTSLRCASNQLTSLDVSKNTALTELECQYNQLTSLNVSRNTYLTQLYCQCNQLTSLDVSNNTALTNLNCGGNQLTSLDLSKNTALTEFGCDNNTFGIGTVEGSYSLSELSDGFDPEKTSDWEGAELSEDGKSLVSFTSNTVTYNYDCGNDHTVKFTLIAESFINDNGVKIDENNFPDATFREYVLKNFDDGDGVLSEEEIAAVTKISISGSKSKPKNITTFKGIEHFTNLKLLYCYYCQLTSIDVSGNTALTTLYCNDNNLTSLALGNNKSLKELRCNNNKIAELDLSENTAMTVLWCQNNGLANLVIDKNVNLATLYCYDNPLTGLDVSGNEKLKNLYCYKNGLKELDIRNNPLLTDLRCNSNSLESLDISGNNELICLYCFDNELTSLCTDNNINLAELRCGGNKLTGMELDKNTKLNIFDCEDNAFNIGAVKSSYDLGAIKSFVASKASAWKGAEYSEADNSLINFENAEGGIVTYTYDCGNGKSAVFSLVYDSFSDETVKKLVVTATAGDGSVTLTWNDMGEGVTYKVYGYNGSKYTAITGEITENTYTASGLKNGTKYGYLVRAKVNGKWTSYTADDVVYATPAGSSVSDKPVVTAAAGDGSVTLTWNDMGEGVIYKVYGYSGGKYTALTGEITENTYTASDLENGKKYGYLVRAKVNGKWTSYTKDDVVYATPSRSAKPVVSAKAGNGYITLSWESVSEGAYYKVYSYNGSKYTAVTDKITETTYTIDDLENGKKYGYLVRAYVDGVWSSYTSADVVYATPEE